MFAAHKGGPATRRRQAQSNQAETSAAATPTREEQQASLPLVEPPAAAPDAPPQPAEPARARPAARRRSKPRLRVVQLQVPRGDVTAKIAEFLDKAQPQTPCLVVDLDVVEQNYLALARSLEPAQMFYSVKANPAPEILKLLARLGAAFDAASPGEIDLCLALGIDAARLSYGNTIKKQADIAYAYEKGVRLFAFDAANELEKLAAAAPGSRVFCRVLVDNEGAEWPLSRKFGCSPRMAAELLVRARALGLDACGLSFHIGSQQTDLTQWDKVIEQVARLYREVRACGVDLRLINLGGGFPSRYHQDVPSVEEYGAAVVDAVRRHFGDKPPELIVEPGRAVVGDAGVIESEVVLISTKDVGEQLRWVYLDIGKFSGLVETMDEAIKYRLVTPHDGGPSGPVVLAGPTCDSVDILYERTSYRLPLALKEGDKVRILSCGAYTTTYSTVGFNGFAPLKAYYL
jgi:ornithine decarboxylase